MANERLRLAMSRSGATAEALATVAEVDPKTVHRWLGGRVPHPRHRWTVAKYLHEDEEFIWPGVQREAANEDTAKAEIVASFPYRSDVPVSKWWDLISGATKQIDLLGYTLYFLPMQHPRLIDTLIEKCEAGCRIRACLADPESSYVADRDAEEDLGLTLVSRIQTTLKYFKPMAGASGFEMRYQRAPLYNSIFRFDDEMFMTPHLYATPGAAAPLLHLRRLGPNGMFSRFAAHFEAIWTTTTPTFGGDASPIRVGA
jgi:hypothetical protein